MGPHQTDQLSQFYQETNAIRPSKLMLGYEWTKFKKTPLFPPASYIYVTVKKKFHFIDSHTLQHGCIVWYSNAVTKELHILENSEYGNFLLVKLTLTDFKPFFCNLQY